MLYVWVLSAFVVLYLLMHKPSLMPGLNSEYSQTLSGLLASSGNQYFQGCPVGVLVRSGSARTHNDAFKWFIEDIRSCKALRHLRFIDVLNCKNPPNLEFMIIKKVSFRNINDGFKLAPMKTISIESFLNDFEAFVKDKAKEAPVAARAYLEKYKPVVTLYKLAVEENSTTRSRESFRVASSKARSDFSFYSVETLEKALSLPIDDHQDINIARYLLDPFLPGSDFFCNFRLKMDENSICQPASYFQIYIKPKFDERGIESQRASFFKLCTLLYRNNLISQNIIDITIGYIDQMYLKLWVSWNVHVYTDGELLQSFRKDFEDSYGTDIVTWNLSSSPDGNHIIDFKLSEPIYASISISYEDNRKPQRMRLTSRNIIEKLDMQAVSMVSLEIASQDTQSLIFPEVSMEFENIPKEDRKDLIGAVYEKHIFASLKEDQLVYFAIEGDNVRFGFAFVSDRALNDMTTFITNFWENLLNLVSDKIKERQKAARLEIEEKLEAVNNVEMKVELSKPIKTETIPRSVKSTPKNTGILQRNCNNKAKVSSKKPTRQSTSKPIANIEWHLECYKNDEKILTKIEEPRIDLAEDIFVELSFYMYDLVDFNQYSIMLNRKDTSKTVGTRAPPKIEETFFLKHFASFFSGAELIVKEIFKAISELQGYEHITSIAIRVNLLDDLCDVEISFGTQRSCKLKTAEQLRDQLETKIKQLHELELERHWDTT